MKEEKKEAAQNVEEIELDSHTKSELITAQFLVIFFAATTVALAVAIMLPILKLQPYSNPGLALHLIKFQLSRVVDEDGSFLQEALISAIRQKDLASVQALVRKPGAKTADYELEDQMTPLHVAVDETDVGILKALLRETHTSQLDSSDGRGFSALHWAVARNWKAGYEMLLTAGASVDVPSPCSNNLTPFHMAAQASFEATEELIKFAGSNRQKLTTTGDTEKERTLSLVNLPLQTGVSALHMALSRGLVDVAQLLVKHGADPRAVAHDGMNVVLAAASSGKVEALKYVITDLKPTQRDITSRLSDGRSAFHLAFLKESIPACKYLIERGYANLKSVSDQQSPIQWAVEKGWTAGVKLLLDNQIAISPEMIDDLIDQASDNDNKEIVEMLLPLRLGAASRRVMM